MKPFTSLLFMGTSIKTVKEVSVAFSSSNLRAETYLRFVERIQKGDSTALQAS